MHFNRICGVTSVQSHGARARVELGGWLEPALSAVTAPSQVLSQSGSLSCITGSEWLRAQAAFRTAGWAAGSQPSARGERGGLFYKRTRHSPVTKHQWFPCIEQTHTAELTGVGSQLHPCLEQ